MPKRSYSAGRNKSRAEPSSRVRVYERPDLPGRIFMTRAWVKTESGRPVEVVLPDGTTWHAAELIAEKTATERRLAILGGRTATGGDRPVSVEELLEKYRAWYESQDRSPRTRDEVERARLFWLAALDPKTSVLSLTSSHVEKVAASARRRGGHSTRWDGKRLAFLRAAVLWGLNKARLYDVNPLRGLEMPDYEPDVLDKVYDADESVRLATPHADVDWRVTLAASVVVDTGRRISQVLGISTERDLLVTADRLCIVFRRETEGGKKSKTSAVPVSRETQLLVAHALERPEVAESGWLFPEGRTEYVDAADKPWDRSAATAALHAAEDVLGIERVTGRAWHGIKRRHVTESWEIAGGDAGLVGDVTGNVSAKLLKDVYRRTKTSRTEAHVDRVRASFEAEKSTRESTRESES